MGRQLCLQVLPEGRNWEVVLRGGPSAVPEGRMPVHHLRLSFLVSVYVILFYWGVGGAWRIVHVDVS